jgi:LPXTG-site transpeptidase (sortase) family protein
VRPGELTHFRALRGRTTLIDAASSGLARYNTSANCEVPNRPCYDAPFLDKVARIDLGAPPTVPGAQTTFITGHANRFHPDDPSRGVFTRLQQVRKGDTLVLTTTRGRFVYAVTAVLTVPFDKLTTNPAVVTVRPDTVVAISCVIPPDRSSYTGNVVVVGTLRASTPS